MNKLKTLLSNIVKHLNQLGRMLDEAACGLLGHIHIMVVEGKEGLVGRLDVSRSEAAEILLCLNQSQANKLDTFIFRKVK